MTEHAKAVQVKQQAHKISNSLVESDDKFAQIMESNKRSQSLKPVAVVTSKFIVDYSNDKFFAELSKL